MALSSGIPKRPNGLESFIRYFKDNLSIHRGLTTEHSIQRILLNSTHTPATSTNEFFLATGFK